MQWHPSRTVLIPALLVSGLALGDVSGALAQGRRAPAQPADAIPAHRAALFSGDAQAALAASAALGAIADPAALDALLDALALGLAPDVAAAALRAVAEHADVRALDTLTFFARYRDARVRAAAIHALGRLSDRRTIRPVLWALTDQDASVRATAIAIVADKDLRAGIEPMLALLEKGEEATVPALAAMADANLAKALGELIGDAPNALLAGTLGGILTRADFGPEVARVQVVRTLAKISGRDTVVQLQKYVDSLPDSSPRQSRREAKAIIKAREQGGKSGAAPRPPTGAKP